MRIPFRIVDVFTGRPLAGNQLCVVPEPVAIGPEAMQAVAAEIGFSETTFVTAAGGGRYSMRIFTPTRELPFAGHPSLGTAFVLVSEGIVSSPVVQSVEGGEFPIEVDVAAATARMRQHAPTFGPEADRPAEVAGAVGVAERDLHPTLPCRLVSTGLPYLIVPLATDESVGRATPSLESLRALLDPFGIDGLYLFALDGRRAHARMFTSDPAIVEDAATGSAAGPLGAYAAEHGLTGPGRLVVSQGAEIGRPSSLLVDVERAKDSWVVHVGGGVVAVARGEFDLPLGGP